jgi:hypothetical protein
VCKVVHGLGDLILHVIADGRGDLRRSKGMVGGCLQV